MKIDKIIIFIISFLFIFCVSQVSSEEKILDKNDKSKYQKKISPFDVNTEKLKQNFSGTDIEKLYNYYLDKVPLSKGEYETTSEFNNKLLDATSEDLYAFKINNFDIPTVTIHKYDADLKKIKIEILTEGHKYQEFWRANIILKQKITKNYYYVARNAYNAKFNVKSRSSIEYGISIVNENEFGSVKEFGGRRILNIELFLSPSDAIKLKNNLGSIIICKPSLFNYDADKTINNGNYLFFKDILYVEPTFSRPREYYLTQHHINVEVVSVWFYNIKTGEILYKHNIKQDIQELRKSINYSL